MRAVAIGVLAAYLTVPGCTALMVVAPAFMSVGHPTRQRGAIVIVGTLLFVGHLVVVWALAYLFGREAPPPFTLPPPPARTDPSARHEPRL